MWRNYIKIAFRNIWKAKQVTFVNVVGLSVAIAAAMLLCMTVYREFSFDNFHEKGDRIFSVYKDIRYPDKADVIRNMPHPMGPAMKAELPGVKEAVRFFSNSVAVRVNGVQHTVSGTFTEPSFMQIFSFPLVKGAAQLDLTDIVLSERTAENLFGAEDAVGKQLEIKIGEQWKPLTVTGVLQNAPENSTVEFAALVRLENHIAYPQNNGNWFNINLDTFVELEPGTDPRTVERASKAMLEKYYGEDIERQKKGGAKAGPLGEYQLLGLVPMKDVHFSPNSNLGGEETPGADVALHRGFPAVHRQHQFR
ncbi:ABC transporter permease [Chitinophaga pollutisoli]|uniref:ABC transporter permease n=1 Tax=Chitinophaga pollutisoli TaxID=3133966 RepID=A0ABZ2YHK9_9BACT